MCVYTFLAVSMVYIQHYGIYIRASLFPFMTHIFVALSSVFLLAKKNDVCSNIPIRSVDVLIMLFVCFGCLYVRLCMFVFAGTLYGRTDGLIDLPTDQIHSIFVLSREQARQRVSTMQLPTRGRPQGRRDAVPQVSAGLLLRARRGARRKDLRGAR